MKKRFLMAAIVALLPAFLFAQFSLRGKILEESTNKSLTGAHLIIKGTSYTQVSNFAGEYSFTNLKPGEYKIIVSFIGFETQTMTIQVSENTIHNFEMVESAYMNDEVIIVATKVGENTPTTFKNLDKEELKNTNLGQDLPILLNMMPSTITTSDAGAGIGYTGLRIRGTDMTRINVTVNGIPLNDAESHGVFWVNMPDFTSSIDNIQVQRGVGTSTNGAAAFGASINLQTTTFNENPYAEINSSVGSFNTWKNNVRFGTGLLKGGFTFDGRLSKITSDGYIDRAFSNLKSFFVSGAYYGKNTIVKLNIFSGEEHTYQAWNGVPKVRLNNDLAGMQRYEDHWLYSAEETEAMINSDSRTYNLYTYENETDNYQQDHYQLLFSQKINEELQFNAALHYTHGEGYYEQYKKGRDFADYLIDPISIGGSTINVMDLIQQKWLDNDFYGTTYSLTWTKNKIKAVFGGAWNYYDGDHFGEVIWSEYAVNIEKGFRWYENTGTKRDFNAFTKVNYQVNDKLNLYGDLQFRSIKFEIDGIHDDLRDITQTRTFDFVNPKAGLFYRINGNHSVYGSIAISNREPNRSNYRDADENYTPKSERMLDYEMGYKFKASKIAFEMNAFFMDYKDQLVLTGEINDVGAAIMTNVPESYRLGLELAGGVKINNFIKWEMNATLSRNKIKEFDVFVDNWDNGEQNMEEFENTDLSFSPNFIAAESIILTPVKNLRLTLTSKYVSRQYIDNTSNKGRSLDPYFVTNFNLNYSFKTKLIPEVGLQLLVNNIFNEKYETNAWVYRYILGDTEYEMDGYYPQAGINFLLGLQLKF